MVAVAKGAAAMAEVEMEEAVRVVEAMAEAGREGVEMAGAVRVAVVTWRWRRWQWW